MARIRKRIIKLDQNGMRTGTVIGQTMLTAETYKSSRIFLLKNKIRKDLAEIGIVQQ